MNSSILFVLFRLGWARRIKSFTLHPFDRTVEPRCRFFIAGSLALEHNDYAAWVRMGIQLRLADIHGYSMIFPHFFQPQRLS